MNSHTYASTFPVGFDEVVKSLLLLQDPEVVMHTVQPGFFLYTSTLSPKKVRSVPFFNNTFLVLSQIQAEDSSNVKKVVDMLFRKVQFSPLKEVIEGLQAHTFRFIVSKDNQIQPMISYQRTTLEPVVSKSLLLAVDRTSPDVEIWFTIRKDGNCFCGLRLTKREKPERGMVGKEIAYLLHYLSNPNPEDVFFDPFASFGEIVQARLTDFAVLQIKAHDVSARKIDELEKRFAQNQAVEVAKEDATEMSSVSDKSVDRIVTIPPWSLHEKPEMSMTVFYDQIVKQMGRVLKNGGRAVVLTSCKKEMREALEKRDGVSVETIRVLVAGKKAIVFILTKE